MSDWTLYFNPKCGTARKVRDKLESKGIKPNIIEYLENPPTQNDIEGILQKLGTGPESITRFKEAVWKEKNPDTEKLPREKWIQLIVDNPILLQRPIVIKDDRAVVARPPEKVEELF